MEISAKKYYIFDEYIFVEKLILHL